MFDGERLQTYALGTPLFSQLISYGLAAFITVFAYIPEVKPPSCDEENFFHEAFAVFAIHGYLLSLVLKN